MNLHHYHRVHPRLRGVRIAHSSAPSFPAGSLSPAQVLTAYGFKQNQYKGASPVKLGIGSLGGGVVQQDIDNAVQLWGMAAPKMTIRTVGGAGSDPTTDQDSNVENMLDIQMMAFAWWWLTGTAADITITFGPNASNGMTEVTQDPVNAGVQVASWSWGSAADGWDPTERAGLSTAFAAAVAAGVTFCAAAGDNSIDDSTSSPTPDYPCSDVNVWAAGGTFLALAANGTISQETAWATALPATRAAVAASTPPSRCRLSRPASCRAPTAVSPTRAPTRTPTAAGRSAPTARGPSSAARARRRPSPRRSSPSPRASRSQRAPRARGC